MFSIDVTLKYSPIPVSVQRKEVEDAEGVYQQILKAMGGGSSELIELTCEKQTSKKVAIFSDQISAVILSDKSGAAAAGRAPGFLIGSE
ncbi:hypothetical protein IQ249_14560 [Lusitaniella coriacea LEGE 07157]|uniref:UPF0367 protein IQ249_14560 n=1 Tax=Lusitaniella coriacea LEGE 07157 TaxID=945747 RepID=A0A8J7DXK3_9CYAN|nr:hypothetical protein [Lusitaniella coriacea]MBE9117121.1 hypothetical protein [Lusitaniella coriacea LEGE 07157]